jgi:hypothetical protein
MESEIWRNGMGFAGEGVGETWLIAVAGGEFDKRRSKKVKQLSSSVQ